MDPKTTDDLNFLSKRSFRKFINIIKVAGSYFISKWIKQPLQWGLPVSITIEPTTTCNLKCPECPSGTGSLTRSKGSMEFGLFKKIIDELHKNSIYVNLSFQGEPFLHRDFPDLVKYAVGKGIYTSASTNAHFLDNETAKETIKSGLDRLIISIDGTTQYTYSSYRTGGDLDKVIEGALNIISWKKELNSKTPYTIFQFLVTGSNEHQVEGIKKLGDKVGIDKVLIKTLQIGNYRTGNPLMPKNDKYSRYKKQTSFSETDVHEKAAYSIKNQLSNHCWRLWHSAVVTWDGTVVPCCFDKDARHPMGELANRTFKSVWKDKPYREFRASVLSSRSNIEICRNCSEGTKVWV